MKALQGTSSDGIMDAQDCEIRKLQNYILGTKSVSNRTHLHIIHISFSHIFSPFQMSSILSKHSYAIDGILCTAVLINVNESLTNVNKVAFNLKLRGLITSHPCAHVWFISFPSAGNINSVKDNVMKCTSSKYMKYNN